MLVAGCGGGGTSGSGATVVPTALPIAPGATTVSGTVAVGAPLAGATVTLTDTNGVSKTATTTSSGAYIIDVSGLSAPIVVKAAGLAGSAQALMVSALPSLAQSVNNVCNVTRWTTAIAAMVSSTGVAKDLDAVKDRATIVSSLLTVDTYTKALMAPSLAAIGMTGNGPIGVTFAANGTGYDAIYNNLLVGTTPSGAVFMSNEAIQNGCYVNGSTGCVTYSDPLTQTTTNPNVCGSDIATGAPIPCVPGIPATSPIPNNVIAINTNNAYSFGCSGCIFWGKADNFAGTPTQTPLNVLATATPTPGPSGQATATPIPTASPAPTATSTLAPSSGDYYFHWNCNGDPSCLSLSPNGQSSGSIDEGNFQSCSGPLTFAQKFWGPAATYSCNQSPT